MTVTGITSATPGLLQCLDRYQCGVSAGTYLLGWTTLQTAAAAEDANNFALTAGGTLATSVTAGMAWLLPVGCGEPYSGSGVTILPNMDPVG